MAYCLISGDAHERKANERLEAAGSVLRRAHPLTCAFKVRAKRCALFVVSIEGACAKPLL